MFRKICGFLRAVIIIILVAIAGLMFVPRLMGYDSLVVLSGSMEPGIHVGSVVLIKPTTFEELKVGDIVTYKIAEDVNVTHRITSITPENQIMTTKGDANNVEDPSPVAFAQVVGKAHGNIPYIGYISVYIKTKLGIGVICGLLAVMILLSTLPELLDGSDEEDESENKNKDKKKKKNKIEDENIDTEQEIDLDDES